MAIMKAPIPEADYTVSRSCIMTVIEDLKRYTHMGDDVNILFPNSSQVVPTKGSTIHDTNRKVEYLTTDTIHVEVEEDTDPEFMLNVHTTGTNGAPVFLDSEINLAMYPIYYRHNVTLSIKYRSDSRSKAINWRNGIKTKLAAGAQFGVGHTLKFMFGVPQQFLNMIGDIYNIRESVIPTGEKLLDYFKRHSASRLTTIHDPHGAFSTFMCQESQARVVGIYDFTDLPDKTEKEEDTSTHTATLVYKFHYMKPEYMTIVYPVSVYNELIPAKYTEHLGKDIEYEVNQLASVKNVAYFHQFEMQNQIQKKDKVIGFCRYPIFDDVILNKTFQGYTSIASFLLAIDKGSKHLLNLKDLDIYYIHPAVLKFIEEVEYRYMTSPHKSVLAISVQMDNKIFSYNNLTLDDKLDLYAASDLNIKKQYRVVLDVCHEWYMLDRDAIDRLLRYPEAFEWILGTINAALKVAIDKHYDNLSSRDWFNKNHFTKEDFYREIAILLGKAKDSETVGFTEYNTSKDDSGFNIQGNNIFNNIPRELIDEIRRTSKRMRTVFATGIIAYKQ